MDLRKDFEFILREWGYPILLLRQDTRVRCSCWNEKTQEADVSCPICFGLGYAPIVEKHTVRDEDVTITNTTSQNTFGEIAIPGRYYYVKHDMAVREGDLIFDVDWTEQGRPVYKGGGIYEVNHIDPQRFNRGELIFQKLYCEDQPVQKKVRGIRVAQINGITNYEIALGK